MDDGVSTGLQLRIPARVRMSDAFFRDQYTSPPVTTNILPSTVDLTENAGDKSLINDAVLPSPGQYFLRPHGDKSVI